MNPNPNLYNEMKYLKEEKNFQRLTELIEVSLFDITNAGYTLNYYQLLKDIELININSHLGRLTIAWLAFLNGDNKYLHSIINNFLKEEELYEKEDKSLYYSLKALMLPITSINEKLYYSKLSIEILPDKDVSLFMANAKLTYAQMLAGTNNYREAAKIFGEAYNLFYGLGLEFPAIISITNKLLNIYNLGELDLVINEGNALLTQASSFQGGGSVLWGFIHLPLGMSYYQMNKINLACYHLELAKNCIDNTKLLHVFGVVEPYLLKGYYLLDNRVKMKEIIESVINNVGHMNYIYSDVFQCLYYILSEDTEYRERVLPIIERLEVEFSSKKNFEYYQLVEVLLLLKQREIADFISIDTLLEIIKKTRYTGMLSQLQELLIFLAEINYTEKRYKQAEECLIEAIGIKNNTGMRVSFHLLGLKSVELLKKLDLELYSNIANRLELKANNNDKILTQKERDIMELVASGRSNSEIAGELFLSLGTVKWYLNQIYSKLYVKNRTQAILKLKTLGILK